MGDFNAENGEKRPLSRRATLKTVLSGLGGMYTYELLSNQQASASHNAKELTHMHGESILSPAKGSQITDQPKIQGVLPVLQMPYMENDDIDYDVLQKETDFVFKAGADGIVLAQASEVLRLTYTERLELTKKLPEMAQKRGSVTISVGTETERAAAAYAEAAQKAGADAVMAIPPITVSLSSQRLFEYYKTIHDAIAIPMVVQDASGYVGKPLALELQVRMRTELGPRVYFKPEAQPIGPTLSRLQELLNHQGIVFEGSGGIYLIDSYRRGISGTIPGSDLIKGIVEIWRALRRGDDERAYKVYFPLAAIIIHQLPSLDAYMAIEKYLLVKQGIFKNEHIRRPSSFSLDKETKEEIDRLFVLLERALAA